MHQTLGKMNAVGRSVKEYECVVLVCLLCYKLLIWKDSLVRLTTGSSTFWQLL